MTLEQRTEEKDDAMTMKDIRDKIQAEINLRDRELQQRRADVDRHIAVIDGLAFARDLLNNELGKASADAAPSNDEG
jgi:hypothetical protein